MEAKKQVNSSKSSHTESKSLEFEISTSYRELRVCKLAFDSAMQIFELSKKWPPEEKYSLTDQIRRASRSVCSNIGEAWQKRRYPSHSVCKLSDSDAEAAETEVWLDFALKCGYLFENDHKELRENYDHIGGMLVNMMNNPEKWCKVARKALGEAEGGKEKGEEGRACPPPFTFNPSPLVISCDSPPPFAIFCDHIRPLPLTFA